MMRKNLLSFCITICIIASAIISCNKQGVPVKITGHRLKPYDTATFNYIYVEALKQKIMGQGGEAIRLLEQASRINPLSDAVYFQMAQILISSGDVKKGREYALKAFSIDNKNFWYMMLLAGSYYQEKKLDSAIIYYRHAVEAFPEKDDLKITLANLYSENNKYESAAEIFTELDEQYGVNEASTLGLVKNLMWEGKWDEALKKANLLIEQYPDEILYHGLMAEIYRGMGDPVSAGEVYGKLIESSPENPRIQLAICDFLLEQKKYDDLLQMLNTVILNESIGKQDKIGLFAGLLEDTELVEQYGNQMQLSVMVLEAAYPGDEIIEFLRPELLIVGGKLDAAAARLSDILDRRPDNIYAAEKLLMVYYENKDYKSLETKGEELAKRFNRSFLAKMLVAAAAAENENYDKAVEELRKAEILAGSNKELILQVLAQKADVLYRMKEYEKAFEIFEEALAEESNDLTILNNYAYFLAEQNLKLKEAEEMARKVIEQDSENNTFLDTYAWVLYKRGKSREAERIMKSIIEGGGTDAEYLEHYGYILKKRRKCNEAVSYWQQALELDKRKVHLVTEIEQCKK